MQHLNPNNLPFLIVVKNDSVFDFFGIYDVRVVQFQIQGIIFFVDNQFHLGLLFELTGILRSRI